MKAYASVVSAEPLPDFQVRVVFDDGSSGIFDCSPFLADPFWKRLANPAFFRLVRAEYGTLVWPDDIDIAPEDVWEGAKRIPAPYVAPEVDTSACSVAESPTAYDAKPAP